MFDRIVVRTRTRVVRAAYSKHCSARRSMSSEIDIELQNPVDLVANSWSKQNRFDELSVGTISNRL